MAYIVKLGLPKTDKNRIHLCPGEDLHVVNWPGAHLNSAICAGDPEDPPNAPHMLRFQALDQGMVRP
eukprot:14273441-Alexandrium_andersonii.AAC.1